jgi:calcineurin-like phosphoesterase family protein
MQTWVTGDEHHGHELLREMRGFASVRDMEETLIANFNAVVQKSDRTFHLGDFAYRGDPKRAAAILSRLNGSHFLIIGNHDGDDTIAMQKWAAPPAHVLMIKTEGERLWLAHYAHRTWPGYHKGVTHLYGHSHNRIPADDRSCDVGVDAWNLMPVSIPQIKQRLALAPAHEDPETQDFNSDNGGLKL